MSELSLTPGSRRKLLRHIEEVSGVNELAKLMQIRVALLRKIILADGELKEACLESGILSPAGFVLPGVEQQWVPIGMNPSFVKRSGQSAGKKSSFGS
ncbi:AraC family transcriptional regulator [Ochrobactrum daejeonense]|nr:AraC family transcriptional regulator [Brucella daejeonensis]